LGRSYHLFLRYRSDRQIRSTEYANLNNEGEDSNGSESLTDSAPEVRSVEYVLTPLEEITPATIRPPSWWLNPDSERQYNNSNNGMVGNRSNNNNGVRQNNDQSDYQVLERRSSLHVYNSPFDDDGIDIGVAGPSTNNRSRSGSGGIAYEIIDREHENTSMNVNRSVNNGYEMVYDDDRISEDLESSPIRHTET